MVKRTIVLMSCVALAACNSRPSDDPKVQPLEGVWWDGSFPERCAGLSGDDAYLCAERLFWQGLQYEPAKRMLAFDVLGEIIDRVEADGSLTDVRLANLYWRRVQMQTALISEDSTVAPGALLPDLRRAVELAPGRIETESWLATFEAFLAYGTPDFDRHMDKVWELMDRDPNYMLFVFLGIGAGLPLDTGVPQRMGELIEEFDCTVRDWCDRATDWVPHAPAGTAYWFGETYARLGDRERALMWYQRALEAPHAESWPHRARTQAAINDIDAEIEHFASFDDDEIVFQELDVNKDMACQSCHGPIGL